MQWHVNVKFPFETLLLSTSNQTDTDTVGGSDRIEKHQINTVCSGDGPITWE